MSAIFAGKVENKTEHVSNNLNKVNIVDNGMNVELERGCIKSFTETPDGISIQLLNGVQILYSNYDMPSETKRTIIHSISKFGNVKKTTINLRNFRQPIALNNI